MTVLGRQRLTTLICNNTSYIPCALTPAHPRAARRQARVSCSQQRAHQRLALRSPHQWSNIVHHIRKSGAVFAPATMGMDSQVNTVQTRSHGGHSHHHHHDNTYLTSSNKKDPGVRITRIGLYVNLGMAIGKGFGGYVFNSQAYVAYI